MNTVFDTPQQEYIAKSKYARYLEKEQRRETWEETVNRYFDFADEHMAAKFPQAFSAWGEAAKVIWESVYGLKVMPSMRLLMTAGDAVRRNHISAFNCHYSAIDKVRRFSDLLLILMHGTGSGFTADFRNTHKLPTISDVMDDGDVTIEVADSKEGWAKAFKLLLDCLYQGTIPKIDYSKIRAKGKRLKTFGGRASGPEPLKKLFDYCIKVFRNAAGRKLSALEVHDICCMVADIVVVGGVRRSALISLSDLSDRMLANAKSNFNVDQYALIGEDTETVTYTITMKRNQPVQPTYRIKLNKEKESFIITQLETKKIIPWYIVEPQRALANNSVSYDDRPNVSTFLKEWAALIDSYSGERGFFNKKAARNQAEKWGRRTYDGDYGCNPCCVPGDTLVLTNLGYLPIAALVGNPVDVWNGKEFSTVTPFSVGEQPTVLVEFSDGTELQCTPNHKFVLAGGSRNQSEGERVEASALKAGDTLAKYKMPVILKGTIYGSDQEAYSQGFYSGDGNTNLNHSWLYAPKYICESRLQGTFGEEHASVARKMWKHGPMKGKSFVPLRGNAAYILNWFAGLLDSDGCVTADVAGNGFQIASTDKDFLQKIRLMLTRLGVQAKVVAGSVARSQVFKPGQPAYDCKAVWRLLVNCQDAFTLGSLGLVTQRLQWSPVSPQRDARRFVKVVAVTPATVCENFCFDEPKNHTGTFNGIVTGQSEILLRSNQFCNLTEAIVRADDTLESLKEKVASATIMGVYQATLTDFKGIDPEIKKNCEEERLLGVSLTGVMDHSVLNQVSQQTIEWLEALRDHARAIATEWAHKLGINVPTAITCVKPSGTVAQLCNTGTGGMHPRFGKYYKRRYRQDNKDPITDFLNIQGVHSEPCLIKPDDQTIFTFVVKSPDGAVMRDDRSAIEQLEHWLMFQRHWCEHKPSITVYVKDEEWMEVGNWVFNNFDEISGVSFLPYDNGSYRQAPFEEITKEEYDEFVKTYPQSLNWDHFYEQGDQTNGSQELACTGNTCGI